MKAESLADFDRDAGIASNMASLLPRIRRLGVILTVFLASGTAANAQWLYQKNESAFDDNPLHIAVTALGQYGFGFRCKDSKIEAVYFTPDKALEDNDDLMMANATNPKIRIRVDKNPVVDIDVQLENIDDKATALGEVDVDLLKSVAAAKSRVAVAMQILGDNYHEKQFNVRGSTNAIGKMLAGCDLKSE